MISFDARVHVMLTQLARLKYSLGRETTLALRQSGEEFVRAMQTLRFRGYTGTRGARLQTRSRRLRDSIGYEVRSSPGSGLSGTALVVYSAGVPYAKLQEKGTVGAGGTMPDIVPKPGRKYLTIPLDDAMTAAGRSRYPTNRPASYLRETYPGRTFVLKTKRGTLFVVSVGRPEKPKPTGKGRSARKLVFLFRLAPKVAVPPRLKFRKTFDSLRAQRTRRLRVAVRRAIAEVS